MFLITVLFNLIVTYGNVPEPIYDIVYHWVNELIGSSLVGNLFILLICYRNRLCYYNKVSVFGLLSLNIVNFLALSPIIISYYYYTAITFVIMIPLSMLVLILLIRKI